MAPEARAAVADLARLRDEIRADRGTLAQCLADARDALGRLGALGQPPDRPYLAVAAVALHGWYTALEGVLERAARILDRSLPEGQAWHRDLLSQAMTELPGVRPAVLPRTLHPDLNELLEFRHFFRHAYAVSLDPAKLKTNLERMLALAAHVDSALDTFDTFLTRALNALASQAPEE